MMNVVITLWYMHMVSAARELVPQRMGGLTRSFRRLQRWNFTHR